MLVLSRKPDESIVIGEGADRVVIKVLEVAGQRVRLGVQAPRHVTVHRLEVSESILRSAISASEETGS
jgi:carbon storage regulator